jgi:adenylate kinase family enzyme
MNAIIFGAPDSGKGTYASRFQSRLGVDVIAIQLQLEEKQALNAINISILCLQSK